MHETARVKCQRLDSFSVWLHPLKLTIDDAASSRAGTFTVTNSFSVNSIQFIQCSSFMSNVYSSQLLMGDKTPWNLEDFRKNWKDLICELELCLALRVVHVIKENSSHNFHKKNLDFWGWILVKQQKLFIIQKVMQMR